MRFVSDGAREVYFVRALTVGLIKIGVSDSAVKRFQSLSTQSPDRLELMGVMLCYEDGALEERLHAKFKRHRAHGEWFQPHPSLLAYISANAVPARPPKVLSLSERAARNHVRRAARKAKESATALEEWRATRKGLSPLP